MAQQFNANVSILGTLTMNSTKIKSLAAGAATGEAVEFDQMNTAINSAISGLLDYKGVFDASGTALTAPANSIGDFYLISVAGTAYGTSFAVGDHLVFNSDVAATVAPTSSDFDKIDNTEAGSSLVGLTDTDLAGAIAGKFLMLATGGNWEDASFGAEFTTVTTSGSASVSINSIDADKIDDSTSTNKFVVAADITKLSNISVTQAVDLDTMESDIASNNAKVTRAPAFTGLIGDGTSTTVAINHALGLTSSNSVLISMFEVSSGDQVFPDSYTFTDANNLSAVFITAPASNAIRVSIKSAE